VAYLILYKKRRLDGIASAQRFTIRASRGGTLRVAFDLDEATAASLYTMVEHRPAA
jgi:hypothetical protein